MFLRDPPPGFDAFDPRGELTVYMRNLPHWRQTGATYFATFRLADALPQPKLQELRNLREEWRKELALSSELGETEVAQRQKWDILTARLYRTTERWLDAGMGSCVLKNPGCRKIVQDSLEQFVNSRHLLGAYVIMPNHVHLLIKPLMPETYPIENILGSIKRWTSTKINRERGQPGARLWQEESYDRIVRDPAHLWRILQYIGNNPAKAGLSETSASRWICEEWKRAGWDFEN